jgi:hypothetical protein
VYYSTTYLGEQRSYSFNGSPVDVYDRRMNPENNLEFGEESESPRMMGHSCLTLTTLREAEDLVK